MLNRLVIARVYVIMAIVCEGSNCECEHIVFHAGAAMAAAVFFFFQFPIFDFEID